MKLTINYSSLSPQSVNNVVKSWTAGVVLDLKSDQVQIQTPSGTKTLVLNEHSENKELLEAGKNFDFLVKNIKNENIVEKVSIESINKNTSLKSDSNSVEQPINDKLNLKDATYSSILNDRGNMSVEITKIARILDFNMTAKSVKEINVILTNVSELMKIDLKNTQILVEHPVEEFVMNESNKFDLFKQPIEDMSLISLETENLTNTEKLEPLFKNEIEISNFKELQIELQVPREKLIFVTVLLRSLGMEVTLENIRNVLNHESDIFLNEGLSEFSEDDIGMDKTKIFSKKDMDLIKSEIILMNLKLNSKDLLGSKVLEKEIKSWKQKINTVLHEKSIQNIKRTDGEVVVKLENKLSQNLQTIMGIYEIPIELNKNINGKLYFRNKNTQKNQEKFSVLVKLETKNIGAIKILCNQINDSLQVYFLVENEEIKDKILENKVTIRKILKETVYNQVDVDCLIDSKKTVIELLVETTDQRRVDLKI